jgi:hypothetical protein
VVAELGQVRDVDDAVAVGNAERHETRVDEDSPERVAELGQI